MDTIDWADPKPSARIPLLSGTRLEMARAIATGKSYYEISLLFPKLVEEAEEMPDFLRRHKPEHVTMLEKMEDPRSRIWRIFHSIPRDMLASLCLGTVGYDFSRRVARPETYLDMQGWGVYVVAIGVIGRNGSWLTSNELRCMIDFMNKYIRGCKAAWRNHGRPKSLDEQFVDTIDNMCGQHKPDSGPRFIETEASLASWTLFVAQLEARWQASAALDKTGDKFMIQAPLYVGCSVRLEVRTSDYDPAKGHQSKLKSVNKSYGLIMALMHYMEREPVHVVRCVTRLWQKDELPIAEVLVGALARCYIYQDGLNRIACGGQSGRDRGGNAPAQLLNELEDDVPDPAAGVMFDEDAEEYVKAKQSFLYTNILASTVELKQRQAFVDAFVGLQPLLDSPTETAVDELDQLKDLIATLEDDMVRYKKKRDAFKRGNDRLNNDINLLGLVASLNKIL